MLGKKMNYVYEDEDKVKEGRSSVSGVIYGKW